MAESRYCPKCRRTMADVNFYTHKDKTKAELCKACQTLHIDNFNPDTFLWLLEEYDVPWIEAEWNTLRDRAYQKDPYKMTGMSVFGKYLSKMKLKQWNKYGWADTERLKQEEEEKRKAAMGSNDIAEDDKNYEAKMARMKEAYENGEITESQYQTYAVVTAPEAGMGNPYDNNFASPVSPYPVNGNFEKVELGDVGADLTEEDKIYLAMKWGRLYRADEWVTLEKLYEEFMRSFDIQDAARLDQLKKICKTSLKMDQAINQEQSVAFKLCEPYQGCEILILLTVKAKLKFF